MNTLLMLRIAIFSESTSTSALRSPDGLARLAVAEHVSRSSYRLGSFLKMQVVQTLPLSLPYAV